MSEEEWGGESHPETRRTLGQRVGAEGMKKLETGNSKLEIGNSKIEERKWQNAYWVEALWARVSNFAFPFSALAARLPWRGLLGAGCLMLLALGLYEREARRLRERELKQLKQQTSAELADQRARAAAALREANQRSARVIADLEARRRQLEREGEDLRRRLALLREQERQRVSEVAALPLPALAERLKSRDLGLAMRDSELKSPDSGLEGQVLGVRGQGSGVRDSDVQGQLWGVGEQKAKRRVPDDQSASLRETRELPDTRHLAPDTGSSPDSEFQIPDAELRVPKPESRLPNPEFVLTEQGARQVETAFVELDACRKQAVVQDGALANCQQQVAASQAAVGEIQQALDDLNQVIRWKDEILARVEAQHRAELKAARGARWRRFVRAVEYVGVGVVIGVVAR